MNRMTGSDDGKEWRRKRCSWKRDALGALQYLSKQKSFNWLIFRGIVGGESEHASHFGLDVWADDASAVTGMIFEGSGPSLKLSLYILHLHLSHLADALIQSDT
jgi:hypothetical protein